MKLTWDAAGEHFYETGVDRGVFYSYDPTNKAFGNGVAWNGLTAVNEQPSGAEPTALYADNIKYLNLMSAEQYAATVEAYTAPDEFMECDGYGSIADGVTIGQQPRKIFGFAYRTLIGNDTEGTKKGYKLHLVYNCLASPSERNHQTVNDNPEAASLSWSVSTTPVDVPNMSPTATLEIDSTKLDPLELAAIEDILYGTDNTAPRLPFPAEIAQLLGNVANTVRLTALTIGSLDLVPTFSKDTYAYTADTTNATDVVTATAEDGATATITVNGSSHTSGEAASWNSGANTVLVTVTKAGATSTAYIVTVTKSAA